MKYIATVMNCRPSQLRAPGACSVLVPLSFSDVSLSIF